MTAEELQAQKEHIEKLKKDNPASEALKGQFEVVGVIPGIVIWKKKTYDLRTISLDAAKSLAKEKFPYLKAVGQGSTAAQNTK